MPVKHPAAILLGTAQDAGYPSAGCRRDCCRRAVADISLARHPACMAVIDGEGGRWLIDCTPEFPRQLALLDSLAPPLPGGPVLNGIFLTHAHIGHYTGLMHLGREAMGTRGLPVYCMPRMKQFLLGNGPWNQLVEIGNIELRELDDTSVVRLPGDIRLEPLPVPHRAEYSETVAFTVSGPGKRLLYLPDIDSWEALEPPLPQLLESVDHAFVDGTFFNGSELPGRDLSEIPHPTVEHTMQLLEDLPPELRGRLQFFHLNHTNPLLDSDSPQSRQVQVAGFGIAQQGSILSLD